MILITGGMGFIGSSIAKILCEMGASVVLTMHRRRVLASFLEPFRNKNLFITPLDITVIDEIEEVIKSFQIKSIIHGAAVYEATGTLYESMRVNVFGTINILEVAKRLGISRLSVISSEAVYQGIKQKDPLREDQFLHVESDRYIPGTKRAEEILALLYSKIHNLEIVLIRASRIYGPLSMGFRNPIKMMAEATVFGNPCDLKDIDEDEGHDNLYVRDCAHGIVLLHLAKKLNHKIYNLGMGKLTTFGEFRNAVVKISPNTVIHLGKHLGNFTPTKSSLDINACLDITRIREDVGFKPEYDIEKGMNAYITWIKDKIYI